MTLREFVRPTPAKIRLVTYVTGPLCVFKLPDNAERNEFTQILPGGVRRARGAFGDRCGSRWLLESSDDGPDPFARVL